MFPNTVEKTKYYNNKIKDIKDYALNKIAKQKRALDIKKLDENYSRKRQCISTNLDDKFAKTTGYSY